MEFEKMKRSAIRELAFRLIYSQEIQKEDTDAPCQWIALRDAGGDGRRAVGSPLGTCRIQCARYRRTGLASVGAFVSYHPCGSQWYEQQYVSNYA